MAATPERRRGREEGNVGRLADRIAIQRNAGGRQVAEPRPLRVEIVDVSDVRRGPKRDGPLDVDPGTPERLHLAGIVGEQPNGANTKEAKTAGGGGVRACVRRKSEPTVGVDRVFAVLLKHVRAQLVHEPDPTSLVVGCVNEDAPSFCRNLAGRLSELGAAVAAKRPERVTGQTLRVEPCQDRAAVPDLPTHEREVHMSGFELEGPQLERSESGAERERSDVTKGHAALL